jgi:hypothetical protein
MAITSLYLSGERATCADLAILQFYLQNCCCTYMLTRPFLMMKRTVNLHKIAFLANILHSLLPITRLL